MNIFLVRHGQSADHEGDRRQKPDSVLGKNGKRQARALAARMTKEKVDVIISSKWDRAYQTAETVAKKLKLKLQVIEYIHEKEQNPALYGATMTSGLQERYVNAVKQFGADLDWRFDGEGESIRDVIGRVNKFREYLLKNYASKNVVVVSHGLFIRTFIILALLPECSDKTFYELFMSLSTDNTGISLMEYLPDKKRWELRYFNEHVHIR